MLYHNFYCTFSCYFPLTKSGLSYLYNCSYTDCYLDVVGGLEPLRCEEGRPKAVRDKVAGEGQQQYYWTKAVQVTNTDDGPDLSSEGAPYIDKTVNVKHKSISGHETQMGLDTMTDWSTDRRSQRNFGFGLT
jgi:hypothetical protein